MSVPRPTMMMVEQQKRVVPAVLRVRQRPSALPVYTVALSLLALVWLVAEIQWPPECDSSPRITIGEVMLVAGCTR